MTPTGSTIIWLLVDSVRSYESTGDERGKLDVMRRFADESVEFTNVVTSAPSTVMSISAMMTSLPSYWIARNYDDFWFDKDYFLSLNSVLKSHGYSTFAFFRRRHPREKFRNVLDPVDRKHWLPHLRHDQSWTNRELAGVIRNVLTSNPPRPVFMFVHFTCRNDRQVSETVEQTLRDLDEAGFTKENTIVVLCSDHGYPDPSRGYTPEGLQRQKLSHDLILTDDNVKIPLYIRYPGGVAASIPTTVSSLDITPTVLDLAGIAVPMELKRDWQGRSLRPLLDGDPSACRERRFVRSDARLLFQSGRITALRTDDYKYMRHHNRADGQDEELYDLARDPLEGSNIAASPGHQTVLAEFRDEFARQEEAAIAFHVRYGLTRGFRKIAERAARTAGSGDTRVLMSFLPESSGHYELASRMIRETFPEATSIHVVIPEAHARPDPSGSEYPYRIESTGGLRFSGAAPSGSYALSVVFTVDPQAHAVAKLQNLLGTAHADESLVLDCNLNTFDRPRFWEFGLKALRKRLPMIREEPLAALGLVAKASRVMSARLTHEVRARLFGAPTERPKTRPSDDADERL
jgi:hypothetical protein